MQHGIHVMPNGGWKGQQSPVHYLHLPQILVIKIGATSPNMTGTALRGEPQMGLKTGHMAVEHTIHGLIQMT